MTAATFVLLAHLAQLTPLPGAYRIVDDRISVQKEVWGLFCSAPKDTRTLGKTVFVKVNGAEWRATGAGRRFGTRTCEGQNPSLAMTERQQKNDAVFFKCRSRRVTRGTEQTEHIVKTLSESKIQFKTISNRYFKKQGEDCRLKTTRITIAARSKNNEEIKTETGIIAEKTLPTAEEKDPCSSPGAIVKLQLSPKVFDAKVGGKPTCLEVLAFDKNQCAVQVNAVFSVDPSDVGSTSTQGCFSASQKIKEEEAAAIIAQVGILEAAASVRIIPKAKKRAQKSYKALAKTTRSKRAREVLGSVTRGEIILRPLKADPPPLPELEEEGLPWLPLVFAGFLALSAAFLGFIFAFLRKKKEVVATELQAKPVATPKKGGGLVCPKCKFEFAIGEANHCPFDQSALERLERDARQTMFVPAAGGMICPTCNSKYPTKARFCGHDRSPLVPDFGQFDEDA